MYVYIYIHVLYLVGGFNPAEKYESQLGLLFPLYGKIKHVPNHQPNMYILLAWGLYVFPRFAFLLFIVVEKS